MAVIGVLGDVVFSVSDNVVNTFDDLQWTSTTKFAEHSVHMGDTILEHIGDEADDITFTMLFSAYLGVNPTAQITKLLVHKRAGDVLPLTIGVKGYGKYRWVITRLKFGLKRFDNVGNLLEASASVTLKAYNKR